MKKKISYFFIVILAIGSLLISCKKATFLNVDTEKIVATREGGTQQVVMHSDVQNFKVESSPEWITTEVKDSVLVLNFTTNNTGAPRTDEVVVTCAGQSIVLPVSQTYVATYLKVEKDTVNIPQKGGKVELNIETDGSNVKVDNLPAGTTYKYQSGKLTIESPANNGSTLKSESTIVCDEQSTQITVIVEGSICPNCKGTGKITCSLCGGRGAFMRESSCEILCCYQCGGRGMYEEIGSRNGSGKMPCPKCGGKGR